jgi:pimeloyl-ACP methyl ester carboxylesterase
MANVVLPHYRCFGSGDLTVFLLHGAYGDGRYFADLAERLSNKGYRVVVWDCPGYGDSSPVENPSIERFAQAAQALVEHEKTGTNVVLGHSMGALIAPLLSTRTSSVDGVILSAGSAGFVARPPEDQERYMKERLEPIEKGMSVAEYAKPLLVHMMAEGARGELVDEVIDVVLTMKTEAFATSIRAISNYDSRPSLKAMAVPTLLIAGAEDPACTADGMRVMAETVADSEFHILDRAGHYGFAEQPEAYFTVVLGFLEKRFG